MATLALPVTFKGARGQQRLLHTGSGLKKAGKVSTDTGELIEGIIEAPVLAVKLGYDVPNLSVGCEQLLHVRAAEAKVLIKMLQAQLGYFLIEGFEVVKVGCSTQGPGISERLLNSVQPGGCDGSLLDGHFRRVIEEGCREELGLRPQRLGGFGFHGFLILLLAEAKLPGNPANALTGLKAVMDYAEQADGRHGVLVQQDPRIVEDKRVERACAACAGKAGRGCERCPSTVPLARHLSRARLRRAQCTEEAASVIERLYLTSSSRPEKRLSRWLIVGKAYAKSSTVRSSCCCRA